MSDETTEMERLRAGLAAALALAERASKMAEHATELADRRGRLIDGAMTVDDAMQAYARVLFDSAPDAPNCVEWGGTVNGRPYALSIQWLDGKSPQTLLAEAMAARDAAEQARFDAAHRAEEWEESHDIEKARADKTTARLSNLLAVIHRDGGHYEAEHGTEKACEVAEALVVARLAAEARAVAAEAAIAEYIAADDACGGGQAADDYSDAVRLADARNALVALLPKETT